MAPSLQPNKTGRVTFVDMHSLHLASESFATQEQRPQVDFPKFAAILNNARKESGLDPSELSVAMVSIDTQSEPQQRLVDALSRSFTVDSSDYRDNFVSIPPGRSPNEMHGERGIRPLISLSPRITYALGRISAYSDLQVLVVTHAFEVSFALLQLVRSNPNAKVGLAFFTSLLDRRWRFAGFLDKNPQVKFFDLDPFVAGIFTGIDLGNGKAIAAKPKSVLDLL